MAPRRILVATDFTDGSERALDWAIELAAPIGASVVVLHAYEVPVMGFPDGAMVASADVAASIVEAAKVALERTVEARRGLGVPLEAVLRAGLAWQEIASVAHELHADLIAVGTHGRTGVARAFLGSIAEKVIRTSDRPVAVIHAAP
jgi:nucleotide-binding universal stress UspA family protein